MKKNRKVMPFKMTFAWLRMLMLVIKDNRRKKKSWRRSVEEEFQGRGILDDTLDNVTRNFLAVTCADSGYNGMDYRALQVVGETFMEMVMDCHKWIPGDERTEETVLLQDTKAMLMIGNLLNDAMRLTRGGPPQRGEAFIDGLIQADYNVIMHMFAEWMYLRAKQNDSRVMDKDHTKEDLHAEVDRITEFLTKGDKDGNVRPRLTSEALMTIGESFKAIENIDTMKDFMDKGGKQEDMQPIVQKRLALIKTEVDCLVFRVQEMIQDVGIANPDEVCKFIMARMGESMDNMKEQIDEQNSRG